MSEHGDKTEYKGAMRLPMPLHEKISRFSELTGNSLNALIVEAVAFLHDLGMSDEDTVPLPDVVVAARAIRRHRKSPTVINLSDRYAQMRRGAEETRLRVAEDPPAPTKAPLRRAHVK